MHIFNVNITQNLYFYVNNDFFYNKINQSQYKTFTYTLLSTPPTLLSTPPASDFEIDNKRLKKRFHDKQRQAR